MKIGEYEQMMSYLTRPNTRTKLAGGTNPETGMGFQKGNEYGKALKGKPSLNIEGKNQYTRLTKEEMQAIIDANPELKTPKAFEKAKLLGRRAIENNPDLVFKQRGYPEADPEKSTATDKKRTEAKKRLEGRNIQLKSPKGYQVHHIMPLAGGEDLRIGDYAVVSKEMNAKMSKYDKKINKLVNEAYSLDYSKTENLKKLKDINNDLFDILKTVKKDLPKKYEGLLGFNKLTPVLDTFDDKGKQVFYAEPQGIDYKKSIAGARGDKVKDTKKSVMQNIADNAPKFFSNPMADPGLIKQGLKDMGKFGKYVGQIALSTPAGAVLATKGLGGTFDPRTTEGRLTAGAEAAFAPGLVKGTEALTKNKILQTILNLGLSPKMAMRAARVASPLGIATLAGEGIYQGGKYMLERKKLLESLTDEQRDDLLSRERSEAIQQNRRGNPEAFSGIMAANGGLISRQGFADGPKDPKMNRRTFMKVMGGLASIPILGKFMKPAAKVVESAAPVVTEAAKGVPPYFFNLVAKIKKFGEDVSQKYATQDREVVTKFKDYELTEDLATGEQTIQRMKVLDDDSASYYGNPLTEETYMNYKPSQKILLDESNPTGGVKKTMPEYEEGTAYLRSDREFAGDIVDESAKISDDVIQEGTKFEDDFMDFEPKKK